MMQARHWIQGSGLAVILFFIGFACLSRPSLLPPCGSNIDCEPGQACSEDNECVDASCLSSADCGINQFCSRYQCKEGCVENGDCVAGETCNGDTHQCEVYGCRDTHLDCALGEYCDTSTGECYLSDEGHCASCEDEGSCGTGGDCTGFDAGTECMEDEDCPDGQTCDGAYPSWGIDGSCSIYLCEMHCDPKEEDPCPRGYSCIQTSGWGSYVCYGDCLWMYENGYTE
jgi:hypothetical protein